MVDDIPSPFVTTSKILHKLNSALEDLHPVLSEVDGAAAAAAADADESTDTSEDEIPSDQIHPYKSPHVQKPPRFELQRRFDNGGSRLATDAERAAHDCQQKIQQATAHLATLVDANERLLWAHAQRDYGNQLYHRKDYVEAMDVYLTCLPAIDLNNNCNHARPKPELPGDCAQPEEATGNFDTDMTSPPDAIKKPLELKTPVLLLFCKVLNNLGQTALQLKRYSKTHDFCTLALEQLEQQEDGRFLKRLRSIHESLDLPSMHQADKQLDSEHLSTLGDTPQRGSGNVQAEAQSAKSGDASACSSQDTDAEREQHHQDVYELRGQIAKLYYKRGKANRLRGNYGDAKADLGEALMWTTTTTTTLSTVHQDGTASSGLESTLIDDTEKRKAVVQQEIELLRQAKIKGKQNKEKAREGMKRVFDMDIKADIIKKGSSGSSCVIPNMRAAPTKERCSEHAHLQDIGSCSRSTSRTTTANSSSLYSIPNNHAQTPRAHSMLRASSQDDEFMEYESERYQEPHLTPKQWYLTMIGRVACKLLEWMGDEDYSTSLEGTSRKND